MTDEIRDEMQNIDEFMRQEFHEQQPNSWVVPSEPLEIGKLIYPE